MVDVDPVTYYDNCEYHIKAEDFAIKMKPRRLQRIMEIMDTKIDNVLELGCGFGVYSCDFEKWVGSDISKVALSRNKKKECRSSLGVKVTIQRLLFFYSYDV